MIIITPDSQVGTAANRKARVTGNAFPYITMATTDGVTINTVNFAPGGRTFWHKHGNGQILQILAGRGLIQSEGGPISVIRAGDTVWVPAGETHWHGAAADSFMTHTAISLGVTEWADAVSDAEYTNHTHDEESR